MTSRTTVIVALVALQAAVVVLGVASVFGGLRAAPIGFTQPVAAGAATGSELAKDGAHRAFDAGSRPNLSVDIGYADLTIVAGDASRIDVGLTSGGTGGVFDATSPIVARADGDTVRVARVRGDRWSSGDDRMVTIAVPPATRLDVISAGDVTVAGLRADAAIRSVGSGSIAIRDFDGARLRASSRGSIVMQQIVAERIDVASTSDRVEGSALRLRDGTIDADDRVTLGFVAGADTTVDAATSDGKIDVAGIPGATAGPKTDDDAASTTVRIGAGGGRLAVHANDGNVTLSRSDGP